MWKKYFEKHLKRKPREQLLRAFSFCINKDVKKAIKIPIRLEKITKPPELRSFSLCEYLDIRKESAIFTNAHKNGATKAIKNQFIRVLYPVVKLLTKFYYRVISQSLFLKVR